MRRKEAVHYSLKRYRHFETSKVGNVFAVKLPIANITLLRLPPSLESSILLFAITLSWKGGYVSGNAWMPGILAKSANVVINTQSSQIQ